MNTDLKIDLAGVSTPCSTGSQLACRYVADPEHEVVFDYLPEPLMLEKTQNVSDFAAVLAFDRWTGNADGRQVVFTSVITSKPANGYHFKTGRRDRARTLDVLPCQ